MNREPCTEPGHERVESYSQLYAQCAAIKRPANRVELEEILEEANGLGCRVTFRAGGHSFDAQSVGNEIVISLEHLNCITVHDQQDTEFGWVTVEPGATWGAILDKLTPHGLVPAVMVTTSDATAGGTLAGDCLSRFSASYGKEGNFVESFKLMRVDGTELSCSRPSEEPDEADWDNWNLETKVFYAAVGGLGSLGAVTEITYKVLRVQDGEGRLAVRSQLCKYPSYSKLAKGLVPAAKRMLLARGDPNDPELEDALSATLIPRGRGKQCALVFRSTFVRIDHDLRPIHEVPIWVWWLVRSRHLARLMWTLMYHWLKDGDVYCDDIATFTFFMDGHAQTKKCARCLGLSFKTIQQTFVVPLENGTRDPAQIAWDQAQDKLVRWLESAAAVFRAFDVAPTLQDVLFVKDEAPFLLSPNARLPGFAVSYGFETSNEASLARVKAALVVLSEMLCRSDFAGRVSLVKNVHASPGALLEMYSPNVERFFELKQELDPDGLLCNDFLMRTFGDLYDETYPNEAADQTDAAS